MKKSRKHQITNILAFLIDSSSKLSTLICPNDNDISEVSSDKYYSKYWVLFKY